MLQSPLREVSAHIGGDGVVVSSVIMVHAMCTFSTRSRWVLIFFVLSGTFAVSRDRPATLTRVVSCNHDPLIVLYDSPLEPLIAIAQVRN